MYIKVKIGTYLTVIEELPCFTRKDSLFSFVLSLLLFGQRKMFEEFVIPL